MHVECQSEQTKKCTRRPFKHCRKDNKQTYDHLTYSGLHNCSGKLQLSQTFVFQNKMRMTCRCNYDTTIVSTINNLSSSNFPPKYSENHKCRSTPYSNNEKHSMNCMHFCTHFSLCISDWRNYISLNLYSLVNFALIQTSTHKCKAIVKLKQHFL